MYGFIYRLLGFFRKDMHWATEVRRIYQILKSTQLDMSYERVNLSYKNIRIKIVGEKGQNIFFRNKIILKKISFFLLAKFFILYNSVNTGTI